MPDLGNDALLPDENAPDVEETEVQDVEDTDVRDVEETDVRDVGRTTGGGSLGHDQPDKVKRDTPLRNATGDEKDPVMPADDATLKTKI